MPERTAISKDLAELVVMLVGKGKKGEYIYKTERRPRFDFLLKAAIEQRFIFQGIR